MTTVVTPDLNQVQDVWERAMKKNPNSSNCIVATFDEKEECFFVSSNINWLQAARLSVYLKKLVGINRKRDGRKETEKMSDNKTLIFKRKDGNYTNARSCLLDVLQKHPNAGSCVVVIYDENGDHYYNYADAMELAHASCGIAEISTQEDFE